MQTSYIPRPVVMPPLYPVLVVGFAVFLFCVLHAPCSAATAIGDTLAAGQALAAGDKLVSRNGKFALGFFQFQQSLGGRTTGVERVCKVACWCIQDNEVHRPTMVEVVHFLEGLKELDMPPMPRRLAAIAERSNV
ncbi:hypothetical protein SORBI_3009G019000 [Sorghum bicolor]|uniref:non-specific serine/threonine protein kinase n=1 Tax=Sorghum bicolor TaxID=4558 RepID=A0A1B6P5Y6_SORBI|nr:hypothetical protein SORBI_3009G019000 [Sorghum bicolor]